MLRFEPLASSSAGCSYVLRRGDLAPLLIDAGLPFKEIQRALNFQLSKLAGCLISHAHGDHAKAAYDLMRNGVEVYGSQETLAQCATLVSVFANPMRAEHAYTVGPWSVRAFAAVHDMPGTLGFYIAPRGERERFLYLTDSAYSPYRFDGLTHIAVECNYSAEIMRDNALRGDISADRFKRTTRTHMSLERLLEMLAANDLSAVQEIHLLHLSDANSDEEAFAAAVRRATGCPVYVAAKKAVRA
jgi:phosphoribosyl 1,2-cyclic phosphodiesterase